MHELWLSVALLITCILPATNAQTAQDGHLRSIDWEHYQAQAVRLLQDYLRIDTSNPPGNELAAAEFFHRLFDQAGIPNKVYPYAPGRANILARLKGDGSLRPMILLNHTDVVQTDPSTWRVPPFSGDIVNGEIYGRGAVDMKEEGLIQAMVLIIAAREHLPIQRDLIFLATADEEVGNTGSAWMIQNHPELLRGAEFLITEGGANLSHEGRGNVYGVGVGEKAPCWIRMTATGRGGHGSMPIADSAPNRLARAMRRVADWETPIHLLPGVERYFHELAQLQPEPRASQFRNIRQSLQDPAFVRWLSEDSDLDNMLRDTVSLTVIKAGTQTNVIPDTAYCELDVRLLPGSNPEEFLRQIRAVVADEHVEIKPINPFRAPNASSADTALYRTIEAVVRQLDPRAVVLPELNKGYTESQMYRQLGIACYGFGPEVMTPEIEATQHAANERIPIEQIHRGLRLLYEIVARTVNTP